MGILRSEGGQLMRIPSRRRIRAIARHDRGATAVEYALIASLIAVVVIIAVVLLGTNLLGLFNESASSYADAS